MLEFRSAIVDECGDVMYWVSDLTKEQVDSVLEQHEEWKIKCVEWQSGGRYPMNESRDYDFDEICPHCDFVNEVVWDGTSKVTECKECHRIIALCSICDHCGYGCGTCSVADLM